MVKPKGPAVSKPKGKRWKKHNAGRSNPTCKKFRDTAKRGLFVPSSGPSNLTAEALKKHNAVTGGDVGEDVEGTEDGATMTEKTWLTGFTQCTNVSFNRLNRLNPNSPAHREIAAVQAAVTEMITEEGGAGTNTEYFCALLTALETSDAVESQTAICFLLSIIMRRVPEDVLRSRVGETARLLMSVLAQEGEGDHTSLLRSTLTCLGLLLRVQEEVLWEESSTRHVFTAVLTFTIHRKPKVRKAAQSAVFTVLRRSSMFERDNAPPFHPAASLTADFCTEKIKGSKEAGEEKNTLHTLGLLRDVMGAFPEKSIKSCCDRILGAMLLSNTMVRTGCMQALHGLFASQPSSACLTAKRNIQIINALYKQQPGATDAQQMGAWLAVMEKAHANLARLEPVQCVSFLPRLLQAVLACMKVARPDLVKVALNSGKAVVEACLAPVAAQLVGTGEARLLQELVAHLEKALGLEFYSAWGAILHLIAIVVAAIGKHFPELFYECLQQMAGLRTTERFSHVGAVDHAVGEAVTHMGPRHVLTALPLHLLASHGMEVDLSQSWLIPILRKSVRQTELAFFAQHFLPILDRLQQLCMKYKAANDLARWKAINILRVQVWSLLRSFCDRPTDLAKTLLANKAALGRRLAALLEVDNGDRFLRLEVMAGLRSLVKQGLENEEDGAVMKRFAKNFLPVLMNLYVTEPKTEAPAKEWSDPADVRPDVRLAALETIKSYLPLAQHFSLDTPDGQQISLLHRYFDDSERNYASAQTSFRKVAIADLQIALLPYLDLERLQRAVSLAKTNCQSADRAMQKKAYRVLEEVFLGRSPAMQQFSSQHLAEIRSLLVDSLSKASPSSQAPRLRCLTHIFNLLEEPDTSLIQTVLPEAVLCIREVGEKARAAAYALVLAMFQALLRWQADSKSPQESLQEFLGGLVAGLGLETPQMISSSLLAIAHVVRQHKDMVSDLVLDALVDQACLLLQSKTREVVKATLAFIKVLLSAFPEPRLHGHLSTLLSGLKSMKEDSRRHFHVKNKQIYTKLIRKFGFESVLHKASPDLHKLLHYIRKTEERKKRKDKKEKDDDSSDEETFKAQPETITDILREADSELEDEEEQEKKEKEPRGGSAKRRKGAQSLLHEGKDDEVTDFLDPTTSRRIVSSQPPQPKAEKKSWGGFKTNERGQLIITGSDDEDGAPMDAGEEKELDRLLEAFEKPSRGKKRKRADDDDDDDDDAGRPVYKAGGKGIHRPLGKDGKEPKVQTGSEYRAKKARGDVKLKGKPDPYAYVPLDNRTLNRRKRAKLSGRLKSLVQGAKKGAAKGRRGAAKSKKALKGRKAH